MPLNRIIVGSRKDAQDFHSSQRYVVISFVGRRMHRSPPKLLADPMRAARIIIRADDTYPGITGTTPLSERQAHRIAHFVRTYSSRIDTLFIHCHFGHGRSCGAAIAIARAFGLPWEEFVEGERVGNGHITLTLAHALESVGYACGAEPAAYDKLYLDHMTQADHASRLP